MLTEDLLPVDPLHCYTLVPQTSLVSVELPVVPLFHSLFLSLFHWSCISFSLCMLPLRCQRDVLDCFHCFFFSPVVPLSPSFLSCLFPRPEHHLPRGLVRQHGRVHPTVGELHLRLLHDVLHGDLLQRP